MLNGTRINENFELLAEHLHDRVLRSDCADATGQVIDWPTYSPDLNPLDYFLWGYLKDDVFKNPQQLLDVLSQAISAEISNITLQTIHSILDNSDLNLCHIVASNGKHFENIVH